MKNQEPVVNGWEQRTLFSPLVVELTLKVGIVAQQDHCQVQVEAQNCTDGELIAVWSIHHASVNDIDRVVALAVVKLRDHVDEFGGPF